jgi:hypothetical protein
MKTSALFLIVSMAAFPRSVKSDVFMSSGGLEISEEGYNLIIKHEVGGGRGYYDRFLKKPTYPGGASGITIGIGYDLRFNSKSQIAKDWGMLSRDVLARLQSVSGKQGTKSLARSLASISIPYDIALDVYNKSTIPRFAALTCIAYPGIYTLHPHIQSAMLSWVFNRGQSISATSSRDREKRAMRAAIPSAPERLPKEFRSSKRLWVGKGLDGLIGRREDEARIAHAGLQKPREMPKFK